MSTTPTIPPNLLAVLNEALAALRAPYAGWLFPAVAAAPTARPEDPDNAAEESAYDAGLATHNEEREPVSGRDAFPIREPWGPAQ